MNYNRRHGITDAEAIEIAVRHLMTDTEHWDYGTEAEARAAIERMRAQVARVGHEMHRERVWDEMPDPWQPVVDLNDPEVAGCDVA